MKEEGLGHGSGSFRLQGTRTAVFPKDMLVQRCISGSWPKVQHHQTQVGQTSCFEAGGIKGIRDTKTILRRKSSYNFKTET